MKKASALLLSLLLVILLSLFAAADPEGSSSTASGTASGESKEPTACEHEWVTDVAREEEGIFGKFCSKCGADYCAVNGHTEGHKATCTQKAICSVCKKEYGDFAAHRYSATTDCAKDVVCEDCGAIISKGGNHDWAPATCQSPKICRICGTTEGEPLLHRWSVGIITKEPTSLSEGSVRYVCEDCGEIKNQAIYASSGQSEGGGSALLIVIIVVVVLAGAGAAVYFLLIRPRGKNKKHAQKKAKNK